MPAGYRYSQWREFVTQRQNTFISILGTPTKKKLFSSFKLSLKIWCHLKLLVLIKQKSLKLKLFQATLSYPTSYTFVRTYGFCVMLQSSMKIVGPNFFSCRRNKRQSRLRCVNMIDGQYLLKVINKYSRMTLINFTASLLLSWNN